MAQGEQQPPRKGPGLRKEPPAKKPSNLDKPGIPEEQLGKVAGGMGNREDPKK